jgi:hypothetical protein
VLVDFRQLPQKGGLCGKQFNKPSHTKRHEQTLHTLGPIISKNTKKQFINALQMKMNEDKLTLGLHIVERLLA